MKILTIVLLAVFAGCGYSSMQNELTGQVKKVIHQTPIICPNWAVADISLGVMRNGVGSMSTQDVWLTIPNSDLAKTLQTAVDGGKIVKVKYDVRRWAICTEEHVLSDVQILE